MRSFIVVVSASFVTLCTASAMAWDGPEMWYASASGPAGKLGGQGILGTGGATDYGITCAHCHVEAPGKIDLKMTFTPPLSMGTAYQPGTKYKVDVAMTGEALGLANCGMNANNNDFAATVEDANGAVAGTFTSDGGWSSTSCPQTLPPSDQIPGTTMVYQDCHAVLSHGKGRTSWSFSWTAPAKGAGSLTLFYSAVDGDCMMSSLDDDVKVGTLKLGEMTATREEPSSNTALASVGFGPLLALAARLRRRRRRA